MSNNKNKIQIKLKLSKNIRNIKQNKDTMKVK